MSFRSTETTIVVQERGTHMNTTHIHTRVCGKADERKPHDFSLELSPPLKKCLQCLKSPTRSHFSESMQVGLPHCRAALRSSRAADALCDRLVGGPGSRLSSRLMLSMVRGETASGGGTLACARGKKVPWCPPPHPLCPRPPPPRPPASPPSALGPSERLLLEEVGGRRPRGPGGRVSPPSPVGRSRWTVPRSNPQAAGESILGGGGKPWVWGRGRVGAPRGKPCTLELGWRAGEVRPPGRPWGTAARCHGARWSA